MDTAVSREGESSLSKDGSAPDLLRVWIASGLTLAAVTLGLGYLLVSAYLALTDSYIAPLILSPNSLASGLDAAAGTR